MSELRDLLIGIGLLVTSLSSAFVLIWNAVRGGRRDETKRAAERSAAEAAEAVIEALADGEIDADELRDIQKKRRGGDDS